VRPDLAGRNLQEHLDQIRTFATGVSARIDIRKVTEPDPAAFVCREATHGYQLLMLGAGRHRYPLRSPLTSAVLDEAPCHVAIVRGWGTPDEYRRILVPTDGSFFSRTALELAVLYAEEVEGQVTVLYSVDADDGSNPIEGESGLEEGFRRMIATTLLTTLSPLLTRTTAKVQVVVRESNEPTTPVLAEARSGRYGLVVVGAESHAVQHRLSIGYDVERLVDEVPCTVLVVVPKIGQGAA
jgi:nucleotide-binding universal stress UspA family protein